MKLAQQLTAMEVKYEDMRLRFEKDMQARVWPPLLEPPPRSCVDSARVMTPRLGSAWACL